MINWAERTEAAILQKSQVCNAKAYQNLSSRLVVISSVSSVPSGAVMEKQDFSIDEVEDTKRWYYLNSSAMNATEIDTFLARFHKFLGKGYARNSAETVAEELVFRDRELDDRSVCLECTHLISRGVDSWWCENWKAIVEGTRSHNMQLPNDLVIQLQRCKGFAIAQ